MAVIPVTRWHRGALSRRYYQRMEPAVKKAGNLKNHARTESEKWEEGIFSMEVKKISICGCGWALQFCWVCLSWEVIGDHYLLWLLCYWGHPLICSSGLLLFASLVLAFLTLQQSLHEENMIVSVNNWLVTNLPVVWCPNSQQCFQEPLCLGHLGGTAD